MKFLFLVLILVFTQTAVRSQTLPEWFRVHTFDDKSIIELNTNYVMFSTDKTGRVKLRWTYTKPQNLSRDSQIQYQSILQETAFDCQNKMYRSYETKWYDAERKLLQTVNPKQSEEWQRISSSGIMGKLFPQACKLIELRKREPAVEK